MFHRHVLSRLLASFRIALLIRSFYWTFDAYCIGMIRFLWWKRTLIILIRTIDAIKGSRYRMYINFSCERSKRIITDLVIIVMKLDVIFKWKHSMEGKTIQNPHPLNKTRENLLSRAPNLQSRGVVRRRISDAAWRRLLDRAYAPGAAPPPPWAVDHAGFPLDDPHVRGRPRARLRNSAGVGLQTRRALPWVWSAVVFVVMVVGDGFGDCSSLLIFDDLWVMCGGGVCERFFCMDIKKSTMKILLEFNDWFESSNDIFSISESDLSVDKADMCNDKNNAISRSYNRI